MSVNTISSQKELSKLLKEQAKKEGFNLIGIAKLPGSQRIKLRTDALNRWLKAGYEADMKWMANPKRQTVEALLEGASSLLSVGLNYYVNKKKDPESLSIARYGWGKDYHRVITKKLKRLGGWLEQQRPNCKWKVCVDSAPLLDKVWAEEAGIGWIGKNSNVINPKLGSWFAIGHLLCTEALSEDKPHKTLCGKCQECIKACPTNAITEPFVVNSKLCLAYHTIENRNKELPKSIKKSLGTWIAGCDICQEVCPWNKQPLESSKDIEMIPKEWILKLKKSDALNWNDEEWQKKLEGSSLKRIKPWMWRRNAEAINLE